MTVLILQRAMPAITGKRYRENTIKRIVTPQIEKAGCL
jgi:hypothetical protein